MSDTRFICCKRLFLVLFGLFAALVGRIFADGLQEANFAVQDLRTPRYFPRVDSRADWQRRANDIREQILVSAGLWPMPVKTPLNAKIFDKTLHPDYSIEKIYFESLPGFYLAGNLYRPIGKGDGPFPAVLNPHGHWKQGRLEDTTNGSTAGRCISFARQGIIAFSYDMVGYNDTHFTDSPPGPPFDKAHRRLWTNNPTWQLWSVTLMGLQTWDSIKALDFLESLPDVDKKRIAITGESGGGTQTFMLGAIDPRLAAQAPVVMVSHTMQGGCVCENMPGLRVEYSNVEIAAAACPRPQILVAATGDWTRTTPTVEGPAIAHIYDLYHSADKLRYVQFDAPHNYNQDSREAVYRWFDHWLLKAPDAPVREAAFQKDPDEELRVFPDGKLPPDAVSQTELVQYLIESHKARLRELQPTDEASLRTYKKIMEPAWRHTLQLGRTNELVAITAKERTKKPGFTATELRVVPASARVPIDVRHFVPNKVKAPRTRIVLVGPEGPDSFISDKNEPIGLARDLLDKGFEVVVVQHLPKINARDQLSLFFTTYNRTQLQEDVRNLISICEVAKKLEGARGRVVLCGEGRAGLWCLLAAPAANAVIADCDQLDASADDNLLASDLFCPGIRNIDTFTGAALLAAPHPLLLHNVAPGFASDSLRAVYGGSKVSSRFRVETHKFTGDELEGWISRIEQSVGSDKK